MRLPSLFAAALLAAACGAPTPPTIVSPDPAPTACTSRVVYASPVPGKVPVARTTPVQLLLDGPVDGDAKITAMDRDGVVDGELLIGDGTVAMIPARPFAEGPVTWEAIVCNQHVEGAFEAGALLRTVDDDAVQSFVGGTYGVDLRGGNWQAPQADDGFELVLRSLLGGALAISIDGAAADRMTVTVASATIDDDGVAIVDADGSRAQATIVTKDNPYFPVALPAFSFDVDGRTVTLKNATLTLGLQNDGTFGDTRVSAELDLRELSIGDRTGCDIVAGYTDATCMPCSDDGSATCVVFELTGLSGAQI